jgi:DNA-directed RNA polymerase subunit RPC12/RpoP
MNYDCSQCGERLQFMGYNLRRGYDSLMIQVGCPDCNIKCYIVADNREDIKRMPHMNQLDYLRLYKYGKWKV